MKIKLSTILSVLVCVVLVAAAVCVGAYRGWSADREEALSADGEMHVLLAEDFNQQLKGSLTGKLAMLLGVEPLYPSESHFTSNVSKDATDILSKDTPIVLDIPEDAAASPSHEDTGRGLSLLKVFATIVLLMIIFGNRRSKKGGIPFGKILAVFTLFKLWKRR